MGAALGSGAAGAEGCVRLDLGQGCPERVGACGVDKVFGGGRAVESRKAQRDVGRKLEGGDVGEDGFVELGFEGSAPRRLATAPSIGRRAALA